MKFDYYILSVTGAASSIIALSFTFQSQFDTFSVFLVLPPATIAFVTFLISRYFRRRYDQVFVSNNELYALMAHYYRVLCTDLTQLQRKFMRNRRRINAGKDPENKKTKIHLNDCHRREKIRTLRLRGKLIFDTVDQLISLILRVKGFGEIKVRSYFILLTSVGVASNCSNKHQGLVCDHLTASDVNAEILMADSATERLLRSSGVKLGEKFPANEISITDFIINNRAARYCQIAADQVAEYRSNRFCPDDEYNSIIAATSWIRCNTTGKQDIFGILVVQAVNKNGKILFSSDKHDSIARVLETFADNLASLRFFKLK